MNDDKPPRQFRMAVTQQAPAMPNAAPTVGTMGSGGVVVNIVASVDPRGFRITPTNE